MKPEHIKNILLSKIKKNCMQLKRNIVLSRNMIS